MEADWWIHIKRPVRELDTAQMDFARFSQIKSSLMLRCATHVAANIVDLQATISEVSPITNVPAMHTRDMNGPLS